MNLTVLMRGGGDLASAVIQKLYNTGCRVIVCDLEHPSCVRRTVAFCNAVYEGEWTIEGITARRVDTLDAIEPTLTEGIVPVTTLPDRDVRDAVKPDVFIDATISKRDPDYDRSWAPLVIGLGPAIEAGRHAHVVIETKRGHHLGRLIREGYATPNTGIPGTIIGFNKERVLRAPHAGTVTHIREIGDHVEQGDPILKVDETPVTAKIPGIVRGLIAAGYAAREGQKVGDVDPRNEEIACRTISDKGRNIAGGVLEAIVTHFFHDGCPAHEG
ncbi:MAG: selenium-dependent molybdenum cofactor biosynthesis protein YqeB [Saccharofermentanales bacterium]|jgi:xanthine dehydrogenase accessory factor